MNKDLKKKRAFTLAEVLITLGIIGIVSAMTIPTLIKNYKEKVRDNQFKKAYATLNQALKMTIADFDYVPTCYYNATGSMKTSQCTIFWEKFREKMRVVKYCPEKSFKNGCIPHYDGLEVVEKENHKNDADYDEQYWDDYITSNMPYFLTSRIKQYCPSFVLNDGMIVVIYGTKTWQAPTFIIDINGQSGKNKFGHDLFKFEFVYNGAKFILVPRKDGYFADGSSTYQMVKKLFGSIITRY